MPQEDLAIRQKAIEARFIELTNTIEDAKAEQYRLQGEYRLLQELSSESQAEATTIDVEPNLKEQERSKSNAKS